MFVSLLFSGSKLCHCLQTARGVQVLHTKATEVVVFLLLQIKTCSISDWCAPEAVWCMPPRPSSDIS